MHYHSPAEYAAMDREPYLQFHFKRKTVSLLIESLELYNKKNSELLNSPMISYNKDVQDKVRYQILDIENILISLRNSLKQTKD